MKPDRSEAERRLKVVHLLGALKPSGVERMLASAARAMRSEGIDVVVVGQGDSHPFESELRDSGVHVEITPRIENIHGIRAWVALLRRERPDLVHIHVEGHWAFTAIATRGALRTVPIIRSVHNVFDNQGLGLISRRVQSVLADRVVARFVAGTEDVVRNELAFGRSVELIPHWVGERFFDLQIVRSRRAPQARPSAVIVGNCSSIKNHAVAIRAVRDAGLDLFHLGDEAGADEFELEMLDELERAGRLRYRGTGDTAESLLAADLFLMPSTRESMSIAMAEAIVVGVPVFVNNVPGHTWALGHPGVTFLDNSDKAWLDGVQAFVNAQRGPIAADALGVLDLSPARGARDYANLYKHVVAECRRTQGKTRGA